MSSEATATTPRVSCLELDLLRGAHQASAPPLAQAILSLRRQTCGCSDVPWVDGGEYSHGSCGPKFCLEYVPWRSLGFPDQIPLSSGASRCSCMPSQWCGAPERPRPPALGSGAENQSCSRNRPLLLFFFLCSNPLFKSFGWPGLACASQAVSAVLGGMSHLKFQSGSKSPSSHGLEGLA